VAPFRDRNGNVDCRLRQSTADYDSSDYSGRAIARLLDLAESEGKPSVVHATVVGETGFPSLWHHQNRISQNHPLAV
jgi:hypothetical protein